MPGAVTGVGIGVTVTGTVGTSTSTTITILIGTTSTGTTLATGLGKGIGPANFQVGAEAIGSTTRRIAAMLPMAIEERPIVSEVGRRDKDALARVIVPAADKA